MADKPTDIIIDRLSRELVKEIPLVGKMIEGMTFGALDDVSRAADKAKVHKALEGHSTDLGDILVKLQGLQEVTDETRRAVHYLAAYLGGSPTAAAIVNVEAAACRVPGLIPGTENTVGHFVQTEPVSRLEVEAELLELVSERVNYVVGDVPGAQHYVSDPSAPKARRVRELIEFAESSDGPGLTGLHAYILRRKSMLSHSAHRPETNVANVDEPVPGNQSSVVLNLKSDEQRGAVQVTSAGKYETVPIERMVSAVNNTETSTTSRVRLNVVGVLIVAAICVTAGLKVKSSLHWGQRLHDTPVDKRKSPTQTNTEKQLSKRNELDPSDPEAQVKSYSDNVTLYSSAEAYDAKAYDKLTIHPEGEPEYSGEAPNRRFYVVVHNPSTRALAQSEICFDMKKMDGTWILNKLKVTLGRFGPNDKKPCDLPLGPYIAVRPNDTTVWFPIKK